MRRIVAMACVVGALVTLTACGYKGPLSLPALAGSGPHGALLACPVDFLT